MKYQAITIDTQTIFDNEMHLHRGLIAQLAQYKGSSVQVVMSEITLREIARKLADKAKAPIDALRKVIRDGEGNDQITSEQKGILIKLMEEMQSPKDHADQQIKSFMTNTGAIMIAAKTVPMDQLIAAYFGRNPPFSNKAKKDEFPDAIALLALEKWAKESDKCILAVSKDSDWKAFCEETQWIDCVDDLPTAMGVLLKEAKVAAQEAGGQVKSFVQDIISGERKEDDEEIRRALVRATELETPHIEYSSGGIAQAQEEYASVSFVDYQFAIDGVDDLTFTVISLSEEGFVATVPVQLDVTLEVEFSFYVHDSIDDEDIPFGSDTVERTEEVEATLILHFEKYDKGDGKPPSYRINDVEISDFPSSFDIGEVSLELGDEDIDFDPDDWKPEESEDGPQGADAVVEKDMPF